VDKVSKLQIQRETAFSQAISVIGIADGTSFKLVWCWRKAANLQDKKLTKTVVSSSSQIIAALTETEAYQLPFTTGYLTIYKIDSSTSKKSLNASYVVEVSEGTAGSDFTVTQGYSGAVFYDFTLEGFASLGIMSGSLTVPRTGIISKIEGLAQEAPTGADLIFTIYKNGVATTDTYTLAAGDTSGESDLTTVATAGDVFTVYITQIGSLTEGLAPKCILSYNQNS